MEPIGNSYGAVLRCTFLVAPAVSAPVSDKEAASGESGKGRLSGLPWRAALVERLEETAAKTAGVTVMLEIAGEKGRPSDRSAFNVSGPGTGCHCRGLHDDPASYPASTPGGRPDRMTGCRGTCFHTVARRDTRNRIRNQIHSRMRSHFHNTDVWPTTHSPTDGGHTLHANIHPSSNNRDRDTAAARSRRTGHHNIQSRSRS